jgi:hypothetical protein
MLADAVPITSVAAWTALSSSSSMIGSSAVASWASDLHVVGVHHPVDEAHPHPLRDQRRLARQHLPEEIEGGVDDGVVALDHVLEQGLQRVLVLAEGEELKRAHADVRTGHAGEDRARVGPLPANGVAGGHRRQRSRRRHPEGVHRLADQVLAHHRPEPRAAVAPSRKGRAARALELDVATLARLIDDLPEQDRAAVAELGDPAAKLVAGVGLGERVGALGHLVAGEHGNALVALERRRVDAELGRERMVHLDEPGGAHRCRREPFVEALGQTGVGVVERDRDAHGGLMDAGEELTTSTTYEHRALDARALWGSVSSARGATT